MDAAALPTTAIALIGFVTIANLSAMALIVRYFLKSQRDQTNLYMTYMTTKNGYLEKARADFGKMIQDERNASAATITELTNTHKVMLDDAAHRLEVCQLANTRK